MRIRHGGKGIGKKLFQPLLPRGIVSKKAPERLVPVSGAQPENVVRAGIYLLLWRTGWRKNAGKCKCCGITSIAASNLHSQW